MESDSGKPAKESGLRGRRYAIRQPFAADAEMLGLESGSRVSGVTSALSPGGCFVCARRPLQIGARGGRNCVLGRSGGIKPHGPAQLVEALFGP
jgi:hypothetical protein